MHQLPRTRRQFVAALAACGCLPVAHAVTALLHAQTAPAGIVPAGYLVSEKYHGVRAVWDGRVLRFRSGRAIAAPADFVARLPGVPLDGELWLGRGRFEALSGLVRRQRPDAQAWRELRYMGFELPGEGGDFASRARRIAALVRHQGFAQLQAVEQLSLDSPRTLQRRLDEVVAAGGEGLMLHRADARYETGRSASLLKLKAAARCRVAGARPCGRAGSPRRPAGGVEGAQCAGRRLPARQRVQRCAARLASGHRYAGQLHAPRRHRGRRAALRQLPARALRALLRRSRPGASARRAPASHGRRAANP